MQIQVWVLIKRPLMLLQLPLVNKVVEVNTNAGPLVKPLLAITLRWLLERGLSCGSVLQRCHVPLLLVWVPLLKFSEVLTLLWLPQIVIILSQSPFPVVETFIWFILVVSEVRSLGVCLVSCFLRGVKGHVLNWVIFRSYLALLEDLVYLIGSVSMRLDIDLALALFYTRHNVERAVSFQRLLDLLSDLLLKPVIEGPSPTG